MVWFGLVFVIVGVIAAIVRKACNDEDDRIGATIVAFVAGGLALLLIFLSCLTKVAPGHVGVKVLFGKVHGIAEC